MINIPLFTTWICEISAYWEKSGTSPSHTVGVFSLNLLALLSKYDSKFLIFKTNNVYERIIKLLKIQTETCNPSLKLGYIKLLSSFLNHVHGIEYIVTTDYWKDALKYCLSNQTVYIIKDGHEFLYELLEKTKENDLFANMLIERILSVLLNNHCQNGKSFPEIREENLRKSITPTLQLISYILESHFKSTNFLNKNHQIPLLFLKSHNLEQIIWQMILMVHNPELLLELEKIMIMIYFLDMSTNCKEDIYPREQLYVAANSIFQIIKTHLSKREIGSVIKLCYWVHYFWQFILPHCPAPCNEKQPLLFENQILVLQMMPLYCVAQKLCAGNYSEVFDDFRENFIVKLFKIMCESTIRMGYSWREIIMEEEEILQHAQCAIHYLLKSRMYFKRDTAVLCFQSILYGLKDISFAVRKYTNNGTDEFHKYSNYVVNLIDAVILFIENYDFTWRETIETICINSFCIDILNYPRWPPKVYLYK